MRAYHDGGMYSGQDYDDDQGGPMYVDGDEGVSLPALTPELDEVAILEAKKLFAKIDSSTTEFG